MSENHCPRPECGRPIADTAYVCHECVTRLRERLERTLALWPSLDDAIGRRLIVDRPGARPKLTDMTAWLGPWCYGGNECGHPSCARAWWSWSHQAVEPPISREDPGIVNLGAIETAEATGNTFTTWARHVSEERGIDIADEARPRSARRVAASPLPDPHDTDRPGRCHCCDFDLRWCPNRTKESA